MSRSRRRKDRLPEQQAPSATARDGHVVVKLADAAVTAIIGEAAKLGLHGDRWDPDALYPPIAEIIARAVRATPDWWAGRVGEGS